MIMKLSRGKDALRQRNQISLFLDGGSGTEMAHCFGTSPPSPQVANALRDLCPFHFSVIPKHYTCCFDSHSQPPIIPCFKAISESQNSSFLSAGLRVVILKNGEKTSLHDGKVKSGRREFMRCVSVFHFHTQHNHRRKISTWRLQAAGLFTTTQGNQWPESQTKTSLLPRQKCCLVLLFHCKQSVVTGLTAQT